MKAKAEQSEVVKRALAMLQSPSPAPWQEAPPLDRDVSRGFLERHGVSPAALQVLPDWEGILVRSSVLEMDVWLVRSKKAGEELARETTHPALLLDDVLNQKGRSREEARAALLPLLITPGGMQ